VLADIRKMVAALFVLCDVWLLSRRPPEILVPGHSPSQEQKCLTVGQRVISVPISEISFKAVLASIPGIVVKSTPTSALM
jgi:hypothetical protein